jgi:hypothetical protein
MHYIYDVMLGKGIMFLGKARGADNLVKLDNELGEILACVLGVW